MVMGYIYIYIYIYLSKNEEQIFLKNPSTKIDILKIKILLFYNIFILHKSHIISIFIWLFMILMKP